MNEQEIFYPANPSQVPDSITKPSETFRKEVKKVMGSIVLFFIVYLVMFLLSIGLVVACFIGGAAIITGMMSFFGIIAGVGLMGVGLMVFIFLVKFMFAVSRYDRSNIIEITEAEQPRLFSFIKRLAADTQTPFPKKIYLSSDVNASVFYDSGFWSMFLPVRKNLQIGLGLVNALSVSEFKAVMAHEFGHFSQRSMKLGSFVYNVNKIIYNLLFENSSYSKFLTGWASAGNIFALFATITAYIANGIRAVLKEMYSFINKNYMRLSREMEFHADAVAASVSGSNNLVSALRRAELANAGYNITLQKCDDLFRQKKISKNIYENQTSILLQIATDHHLSLRQNLPVVNDEFLRSRNQSRINFKDQWASHPTMEDREAHLNKLSVIADPMEDSAWLLFDEKEKLQQQLTEKIYTGIQLPENVARIEARDFEEKLAQDIKRFSFPAIYKEYYDNRQVAIIEPVEWEEMNTALPGFDDLFSATNLTLPKKVQALTADLETVKAIGAKQIQAKTFDFDGEKYPANDAVVVVKKLEQELNDSQEALNANDKQAMRLFFSKARVTGKEEELNKDYRDYFNARKQAALFLETINQMMEPLHPIFTGQTLPVENIKVMMDDLRNDHEQQFKKGLNQWMELGAFDDTTENRSLVQEFINTRHSYFNGTSFLDRQLVLLNDTVHHSWDLINNFLFRLFKNILEKQSTFIESNKD